MGKSEHSYGVSVRWEGNRGSGTSGYRDYSRDHSISALGKPDIPGSSDPAFRGDATRWNPEDLLVASVSACHKLWYLHLCAAAGVTVLAYVDEAEGMMVEAREGGRFTQIVLRPRVLVADKADLDRAAALHIDARRECFIANSVNFPILCEPIFGIAGKGAAV